jgi:D-aminopeptidase
MKAFISVDMEGMPYVVIPGHLNLKGALYEEARKIATKITLITAEELHKNGFDEVVVADSHGARALSLQDLRIARHRIKRHIRPTYTTNLADRKSSWLKPTSFSFQTAISASLSALSRNQIWECFPQQLRNPSKATQL